VPPGEEIEVTAPWDIRGRRGEYVITVTADAFGQIIEVGKDNNSASIHVGVRDTRVTSAKPAVQMLGLAQSAPFLASAGTPEDIRLGFAREPGFARSAGGRDCHMSTLPRAGVPGVTLPAET
jgi:hypothetical protein